MLKFVMLKRWKTIHYIYKLYSNLLSNPRGASLALEADKTKKIGKIFKKLEEIAGFIKKNAKIWDIKKWKTIPWPIKIFKEHIIKPLRCFFLAPGSENIWIMKKV